MGLFGPKKHEAPLIEQNRLWIEESIDWLIQEFNDFPIEKLNVFVPTKECFPLIFEENEETALSVIKIVAEAMKIEPAKIHLKLFSNGVKEFRYGSSVTFVNLNEGETEPAGTYLENDEGKYEISLDISLLTQGEKLIATVAHELCHVKLLGENRIEKNDEYLTDLATVFFGFGIFSTNTSFEVHNTSDSWGWSKQGYLPQNELGYANAIFSYCRNENNPEWTQFLNKQSQADFRNSMKFILHDEDKLFRHRK